jgi:nondiscriminating glutamyl-tRNA synthetase
MVRVRFAPSPTGYLHVGNARTALINYLFARSSKGKLALRIEDTDVERSDARYEASIMEDLRWLGVDWDEGPHRQSERLDIHLSYARTLLEGGRAYKCFCTREELERMRAASIKKGEPPRYDGACRRLSDNAVRALEEGGKPYVVRFKSLEKPIGFDDGIHGRIDFPRDHVDDFIILKQEMTPSYNFAAAVDDMLMGITHVIRGADHISNTPKQIMLFQAFGQEPPRYAHHSLLTGSDKKPLSKRHGVTSIREFQAMGILPSALMNYVSIIGRSLKNDLLDREGLIETFSLDSLSPSDAVFDMEKLLWFNKEYIRKLPVEGLLGGLGLTPGYAERVSLLRENVKTINDFRDLLKIFDSEDTSEEALGFLKEQKEASTVFNEFRAILTEDGGLSFERTLHRMEVVTSMKRKDMFLLLRIFITGRKNGPPLGEIFPLIPKDIIMKRIECLAKEFFLP